MRSFGNQFGNSLYDKTKNHQANNESIPSSSSRPQQTNYRQSAPTSTVANVTTNHSRNIKQSYDPYEYESLFRIGLDVIYQNGFLVITGDDIFAKKDSIKACGFRWDGKTKNKEFMYDDPNLHCFCFMDNVNLFRGGDKHSNIEKWTMEYSAGELCKFYNLTVCNAAQQFIDPNKEQYTNKGKAIIKKLEPSLHGFGNNRESTRDYKVIIGIFAPSFYELPEYHEQDVESFNKEMRSLLIFKNRRGKPRGYIDTYLCKDTFVFKEFPKKIGNDNYDQSIIEFRNEVLDYDKNNLKIEQPTTTPFD